MQVRATSPRKPPPPPQEKNPSVDVSPGYDLGRRLGAAILILLVVAALLLVAVLAGILRAVFTASFDWTTAILR